MPNKFHREYYRCVGLELAGPHSSRTALAVLDYYPKSARLVLADVGTKLGSGGEGTTSEAKDTAEGKDSAAPKDLRSPDEILVETIAALRKEARAYAGLAVHGPLSFPPYIRAGGKRLPFFEKSRDPELRWMREFWERLRHKPRPFLPYLQRPAELWLRHTSSEKFQITDGFGSNGAPLAARLHFLLPHLPQPVHEVFPRATIARLVSSLELSKWLPGAYSDLEKGLAAREEFLVQLFKKLPQIFVYNRDIESMVTQLASFNAFLAALTEFLILKKEVENPPRNFPASASWIYVPRPKVAWDKIFLNR